MQLHDSSVLRTDGSAAGMAIRRPVPGRIEIQVEGVLDLAGARRVMEVLRHARADGIHIDLSATRHIEDRALAHLGDSLRASPSTVTLGGLSRHHQRLLRFLGCEQMIAAANR